MLGQLGGTTTAERSDWIGIVERGVEEGWYRPVYGNIAELTPLAAQGAQQPVGVQVSIDTVEGNVETLNADYLIDCTGLIADIRRSPFLADMLDTYRLARNHAYRVTDGTATQGGETGLDRFFGLGGIVGGFVTGRGEPIIAVELNLPAIGATDELINRYPKGFPLDIPESDIDRADGG